MRDSIKEDEPLGRFNNLYFDCMLHLLDMHHINQDRFGASDNIFRLLYLDYKDRKEVRGSK